MAGERSSFRVGEKFNFDQLRVFYGWYFDDHRTYWRGPGYGRNLAGNTDDLADPVLSKHNTFHDYMPLVGQNINALTYSSKISTVVESKNLSTLFGAFGSAKNMPGVMAVCEGDEQEINVAGGNRDSLACARNVDPNANNTNSNITWVPTSWSAFSGDNQNWTGLLLKGPSTSAGSVIINPSHAEIASERLKIYDVSRLFFPAQIVSNKQNPYLNRTADSPWTIGADYTNETRNGKIYYPLHPEVYSAYSTRAADPALSQVVYTNERLNYYPQCSIWANHHGSFFRKTLGTDPVGTPPTIPNSSVHPYLYRRTGTTTNPEGWLINSVRMSDYYPNYTMFGDARVNGDQTASNYSTLGMTNAPTAGLVNGSGKKDGPGNSDITPGQGYINRPNTDGARPRSAHPSGANSNTNPPVAPSTTGQDERSYADKKLRRNIGGAMRPANGY
ncbi:MAG: hypothetical protein HC904_12620 [Blastochloris sp.]|nr:hypothetical protein [Blastochloris sp.]